MDPREHRGWMGSGVVRAAYGDDVPYRYVVTGREMGLREGPRFERYAWAGERVAMATNRAQGSLSPYSELGRIARLFGMPLDFSGIDRPEDPRNQDERRLALAHLFGGAARYVPPPVERRAWVTQQPCPCLDGGCLSSFCECFALCPASRPSDATLARVGGTREAWEHEERRRRAVENAHADEEAAAIERHANRRGLSAAELRARLGRVR